MSSINSLSTRVLCANEISAALPSSANLTQLQGFLTRIDLQRAFPCHLSPFTCHRCVSLMRRVCACNVPVVEPTFLAEHGVFRRLNPGTESWPSPPDQKQDEHNG